MIYWERRNADKDFESINLKERGEMNGNNT